MYTMYPHQPSTTIRILSGYLDNIDLTIKPTEKETLALSVTTDPTYINNIMSHVQEIHSTSMNTTESTTNIISLHRTWCLWYDDPTLHNAHPDMPWKDTLQLCGEFSTAQDFWTIFNNIIPASQIPTSANYHLFCKGIIPAWEDPANKHGGKFVMTMPKKDSRAGKCDEWWLFTVLAVIGETMDASGDEICGVVVSIRKSQDRIALWLKSCKKDVCVRIGKRWKKALQVTDKTTLKYQSHKDAAASGTSYQNQVLFEA